VFGRAPRRRGFPRIVALLLLGGCYTTSFRTGAVPDGEAREVRGDFFVWGLFGEKTVRLSELCPHGPSRWDTVQTPVDTLIAVLTLGIYVPRHVEVRCAGPEGPGQGGQAQDAHSSAGLVAIHANRAPQDGP